MYISIDSIYCILLITEINASTRLKSVIEKAFCFGYHLHPEEIWCGLAPRLKCSQPGCLFCASYGPVFQGSQIPGVLFVRKEPWDEMGEERNSVLTVNSLSVAEEIIVTGSPSSSDPTRLDCRPKVKGTTCWEPLVHIHESWEINILEASSPCWTSHQIATTRKFCKLLKTVQQTFKYFLSQTPFLVPGFQQGTGTVPCGGYVLVRGRRQHTGVSV